MKYEEPSRGEETTAGRRRRSELFARSICVLHDELELEKGFEIPLWFSMQKLWKLKTKAKLKMKTGNKNKFFENDTKRSLNT